MRRNSDFCLEYLSCAKIGSTFVKNGRTCVGIVTPDLTPYITYEPLIIELECPVLQTGQRVDFNERRGRYFRLEQTLLQKTADRNKKEELEEKLGMYL